MTIVREAANHSKAYWHGWSDGRYGPSQCFTENPRLAEWDKAADRLDYYRGHRAGHEARRQTSDFLEAS